MSAVVPAELIASLPWIQEAAKYIGLQEIPGPQHNKTIQGWLTRLGASWNDDETPWCFTGETELMTARGWVRLDEVADDEVVFQSDENGCLSITPIIRRVEKDYSGDAFRVNRRGMKLVCDEKHRWWGHDDKGPNEFITLDQISKGGFSIPAVYSGNTTDRWSADELWFLAAFLADGKLRYSEAEGKSDVPIAVEFEVSRPRKVMKLLNMGPDHVYTQKKVYGPLTKTPLTVFRFVYPEYFADCMDGYKSLSRDFVNNLTKREARIFLEAYNFFDGNADSEQANICTSDKKILDDLVMICTLAGFHASVQVRNDGSDLTVKQAFRIIYTRSKKTKTIRRAHVSRELFDGKMYCVQVPQGRIVVRSPNGSPIVVGNCGVYVGQCLKVSGLVIPKLYMRALAWLDYGTKLTKPVPGCIVVFSRVGGGHVGFVVGTTTDGKLLVLGGNQKDSVSIAKFGYERVAGYAWPAGFPMPANTTLASQAVAGADSTKES